MPRISAYKFHARIIAAVIVFAPGCILNAELHEEQTEQAISNDFVDGSGTVTVRIKTCDWSNSTAHPTATCSIDSDFVLIGGGAEVEGNGEPGALLTASYPNTDLTTWIASSKDHKRAYNHRLRAYAIGLKLAGVSSVDLRNYVQIFSHPSSTSSEQPTASRELPPGFKLIGGGARVNFTGAGLLLTSSHPDGIQWVAEAKDHLIADRGTIDAYAIGITESIPGFGSIDAVSNLSDPTSASRSYGTATASVPSGWLLASIGGQAQYNNAGRLLTDMIPFSDTATAVHPGATVTSKDHEIADSGLTTAYIIAIRRH